ncbi:MAG: hypothetical protein WBO48_14985, partial [Candidatus Promineifilaceae bacterium]
SKTDSSRDFLSRLTERGKDALASSLSEKYPQPQFLTASSRGGVWIPRLQKEVLQQTASA